MSTLLLSWSARVPVGYAGNVPVYASKEWLKYDEQRRERAGGNQALTNIELEQSALSSALNVFARGVPQPQKAVKQGSYVIVSRGVDGYTVTVDIEAIKADIIPFLPRHQAAKHKPDEAGAVIANRIFGAR